MKEMFFLGIQRERLAPKVQPGEARFRPELDWEKPWRGQVFGARICTRNERKVLFSRDSEGAFGTESFRPELDWEKPWRGQVFGARICARKESKVFFYRDSEGAFGIESATMRGLFSTRSRWGKAVAAPGVRGQDVRKKGKKSLFLL